MKERKWNRSVVSNSFQSHGLPGSSAHGIFQARILEWVAISFSRRSSQPRKWTPVSHIVGKRFTVWAHINARNFTCIISSLWGNLDLNDAFELWGWRRLLRVPWTARRSNQPILKEVNSEYSMEGLMLKLKLQYFGHLMWRADWLRKNLMLGKI